MPDSLADRLNQRQQQRQQAEQNQADKAAFQNRVNEFISDHARPEYDRMMVSLEQRVAQVNAGLQGLPPFRLGGGMVTQDNCTASWYFDKPILNAPNNRLTIGVGTSINAIYFMSERPAPEQYYFHAAANNSLDGIVWVGDEGEFTSDGLIDFTLEKLTEYYFINKPG